MRPSPRGAAAVAAAHPIRIALAVGCAWIGVSLLRDALAADAGLGAPSALLGGVAAFAATLGIVGIERVWARALEAHARERRAPAQPDERLAFDGSMVAGAARSDAPPASRNPVRDERGPRPPG